MNEYGHNKVDRKTKSVWNEKSKKYKFKLSSK